MIAAVLVAVGVLAFTLVVALLIAWWVGGQTFWSRNRARHDDDWQLLGERYELDHHALDHHALDHHAPARVRRAAYCWWRSQRWPGGSVLATCGAGRASAPSRIPTTRWSAVMR